MFETWEETDPAVMDIWIFGEFVEFYRISQIFSQNQLKVQPLLFFYFLIHVLFVSRFYLVEVYSISVCDFTCWIYLVVIELL